MATKAKKKAKKTAARRGYTKDDPKLLKTHSKSKTPLERIAKLMKRSGATSNGEGNGSAAGPPSIN